MPSWFMVTAIEAQLSAEEARAAFYAEAERRLAEMEKTGKGIPAEEVFEYIRARIQGRKVARPKARKLR